MVRKAITIILAVLLIISAVTAVGLYYVMKDLAYYAGGVLQPLEEKTGFRISFDKVGWRFSYSIGITIKNLKIIHLATGTTILSSDKNRIQLRLFPLLRRQIIVSKVIIDNPHFDINRNHDGSWPLAVTLPEGFIPDNGRKPSWFPFSIAIRQFSITNGDLKFHDYQRNTFFHVQNLDADLSRPMLLEPYRFSCSAKLKDKTVISHFSFTGILNPGSLFTATSGIMAQGIIDVQKVSISSVLPYIKRMQTATVPQGLFDAHLECSIASDSVFNASGLVAFDWLSFPIGSPRPVMLKQVHVKFDAGGARDAFDLKNIEITVPGIKLMGSMAVTAISQTPEIDARISTASLSWKAVKPLIPADLIQRYPENYLNCVKDATIQIIKLHLRGCINDTFYPTLELCNGEGDISNCIISPGQSLPQITLSSGSFNLTRDKLGLSNIKARWLSGDDHLLNGTITQPFATPFLDMKIASTVPAETLAEVITSFASVPAQKLFVPTSGTLKSTIEIRSPIAAAQPAELSATADLTHLEYLLGDFIKKPFGLDNNVVLKTIVTPGTLPERTTISCSLMDNSLLISGILQRGADFTYSGTYAFHNMDIPSLGLLFMPANISLQGVLNGEGTLIVPLQGHSIPSIQGTIEANRFALLKTGETLPLLFLNAKGFFKDTTLRVTQAAGSFGLTNASCSGGFYYGADPLGRFNVDVSYLNLDDFIETVLKLKNSFSPNNTPTDSPAALADKKHFFRRFVLDAPTIVKKGKYLSWDFTDGTTRITIKDGIMTYGDISMHAYRGIVNGTVIHDFSQTGLYRLTFLPHGSNVQFEEFLPELQAKKVMAGRINLDGMFTSLYKKGHEVIPNMEGNFKISMKDAKLGKFTVVSKILSLLSFTEIVQLHMPALLSRGMPLESVDGNFTMAHGVAHTDDLFMKSPAMNLSAVGDLNFSRKELNLIVGVQPLETIGKLLGSIPVAGKILTGENKSITISYFQVSGPYADCSVKPIPVESLNQGVKALLNRFYNLPQELFNTGKKTDNSS